MKLFSKAIALALGGILLINVPSALAVTVNVGALCDIKVYLSGASAQDNTLDAQVVALMKNNGANISVTGTVTNGSIWEGADDDWRVIVGEVDVADFGGYDFETDGTAGDVNAPVLCVFKRSAGGSAWGVQPISQGSGGGSITPVGSGHSVGLPVVHMTAANCDDTDNTCRLSQSGDMELIVPDAGLSDVEPIQFSGPNTPGPQVEPSDNLGGGLSDPTPTAISSDDVNGMEIFQQAMFAFGVVINPEFYAALQVCQAIVPTFADVDYDDLAKMPSLSKSQVTSFFSGRLQDLTAIPCDTTAGWDEGFSKPASLNLYNVAAAANQAPPFLNGFPPGIETCVRTDGSGTKAQFRIKFFGRGCLASGAADFAAPVPAAGDIFAQSLVQGSSDMGRCVSGNTTDGYIANSDDDGVQYTTSERWKIGFQATDKVDEFAANLTVDGSPEDPQDSRGYYRFIKIDNQAPTLANAQHGGWFDIVNATLQRRADSGDLTGRQYYNDVIEGGSAADVEEVLDTLIANFGDIASVGNANADLIHPGGQWYGGSMVVSGQGCDAATQAFDPEDNPCTPYTHQAGPNLNNCRPSNTVPFYFEVDSDGPGA